MNELLEKLLNNDLLTEESKKELVEALTKEIENAKSEAKQLAEEEAKVEFAKQFAEDKALLVEAIDTKVSELLKEEIAELKSDIDRFRDLEVEYQTKLVEEKQKMAIRVKADMAELVENLDAFLEVRLSEEIVELKESIEEVKKLQFGQKLFEAMENEFRTKYFNENETALKLEEANKTISKAKRLLAEKNSKLDKLVREKELARVLESLHGRSREVMEAILNNVETDKLEESYNKYIGRVLHESAAAVVDTTTDQTNATVEPVTEVLAEGVKTTENTKVVTGDLSPVVEPVVRAISESETKRLRKLAGLA